MDKLYTTTKKLLELIKEKRPDIEVDVKLTNYMYSQDHFSFRDQRHIYEETDIYVVSDLYYEPDCPPVPIFTTDALLTLTPQLFGGVENPQKEYLLEVQEENYEDSWDYTTFSTKTSKKDIILQIIQECRGEYDDPVEYYEKIESYGRFTLSEINEKHQLKTLDKHLLQKYIVEGMWEKDQVAVLEDIIENINTNL